MSLYSALNTGVAGLKAESSAMAGVADNISNINTVGYKAISTEFNTLVSGGTQSSSFAAGGVTTSSRALVSRQGLLQTSGSSTDMGIDGAGFFVVRGGGPRADQVAFTRAGNFAPDSQGYLRNAGGYYLQGWRLDAQGKVPSTELRSVEPVRVADLSGSAEATSTISFRANLDASAPVLGGAYAAGDMAAGTVAPAFVRSAEIYDAQGNPHQADLAFVKTGVNTWQVEIYARPATDVSTANGLLASGTLRFAPDGSLDKAASSPSLFQPVNVSWTNGAGSGPISLVMGSDGGVDGVTQFGSPSALTLVEVDGGVMGNVSAVSISDDGIVSAVFDNGRTKPVFQLPIATFRNPDGLSRMSGNAFSPSDDSGAVSVNVPGVLGSGRVETGVLEASNADLAAEFTNMIRFQRAYSASSKIITTVDEMLQEVSNLKR